MVYYPLHITSQRAFLVEMLFSSGQRQVVAVASEEAANSFEAQRVARDRYERVSHLPNKDGEIPQCISSYGMIASLITHNDTDAKRESLGLLDEGKIVSWTRPRTGWYDSSEQRDYSFVEPTYGVLRTKG